MKKILPVILLVGILLTLLAGVLQAASNPIAAAPLSTPQPTAAPAKTPAAAAQGDTKTKLYTARGDSLSQRHPQWRGLHRPRLCRRHTG